MHRIQVGDTELLTPSHFGVPPWTACDVMPTEGSLTEQITGRAATGVEVVLMAVKAPVGRSPLVHVAKRDVLMGLRQKARERHRVCARTSTWHVFR